MLTAPGVFHWKGTKSHFSNLANFKHLSSEALDFLKSRGAKFEAVSRVLSWADDPDPYYNWAFTCRGVGTITADPNSCAVLHLAHAPTVYFSEGTNYKQEMDAIRRTFGLLQHLRRDLDAPSILRFRATFGVGASSTSAQTDWMWRNFYGFRLGYCFRGAHGEYPVCEYYLPLTEAGEKWACGPFSVSQEFVDLMKPWLPKGRNPT